jgi:hypothetical protein
MCGIHTHRRRRPREVPAQARTADVIGRREARARVKIEALADDGVGLGPRRGRRGLSGDLVELIDIGARPVTSRRGRYERDAMGRHPHLGNWRERVAVRKSKVAA